MSGGARDPRRNEQPAPDPLIEEIAEYVHGYEVTSRRAWETARLVLTDALGCALLALEHEDCRRHLGPIVPGTRVPDASRVPGTGFEVDPVKGAFDIGTCIRWLDYNDTWLAAEWGHPSDNLGAILAVADHVSRRRRRLGEPPLLVADVLAAAVKAHEVQGVLALGNALNAVGVDHVVLVRFASAAVAAHLLGGSRDQVRDALSQAVLDGGTLRTYRHAPNTGPRKSWAAGDATSRGVRLACMTMAGEPGYLAPLSTPTWGFEAVTNGGRPLRLERPLGSYVMEHVLFKVAFPAEFHGQTAVEAAIQLHPLVRERIDEVQRVVIHTQQPAIRIIDKRGPLHNPADRDHCLQYMTAVALLRGRLTEADYGDEAARDPALEALRHKTEVYEEPSYTRDYLDPSKRAIANAVQVYFGDGTCTPRCEVHYPLGHPRRREEAVPLLGEKAAGAIRGHYDAGQAERILSLLGDGGRLEATPVDELMALLALPSPPPTAAG